jgi:hypothetical protein
MQARPVLNWNVIFTPPIIAAFASLVPSLLSAAWKLASPGYNCTLNGSAFNSPCFAVVWVAALGIGWFVGMLASRLGRRPVDGPAAAESSARRARIARIAAGVAGVVLGIPLAGYVLNPCP